jgi:beta-glucosidase
MIVHFSNPCAAPRGTDHRERPVRIRRKGVWAAGGAIVALAATALMAPLAMAEEAAFPPECPWMDTNLSADQRARVLLDHSTLDQKIRWLDEQSANNPTQTVFSIGGGQTTTMPVQVPCTPVIQYTDGPAAIVGAGTGVTAFPAPVALSASWNVDLAFTKGAAQAYEAFFKHRNVMLAPGLASGRDPRSGRTAEYLGEDAVLSGLLAAAGVEGIGSNADAPVEAVLKHYVANEQELDRTSSSSNVDPRSLRELYTLPFEIAMRRSDVGGVMCAFNDVNNVPSCGNPTILNTILRDEIGFDGWVVTDFGARHSLTAATPSLAAGLDQELNRWRFWTPDGIKAAIAAGSITEEMVDTAAFRVVRAHIAAGLFDVALPAAPQDVVTSEAHKVIAQQIVEEGSVLLKNNGVLPLSAAGTTIAVIGPTASGTPTSGISATSVCGSTAPNVPCSPQAPLDSIAAWASANGGTVVFNNGADLAAAAATAASADVAVVFGYYREGEFSDRPSLSLDGNGDALIDAVADANANTVVVLQTGGPVLMPWIDKVEGVLEVWYAGERMGPAITNLLSGAVNPSGKLTHTFPVSEADLPTAGSPAQYPGIFTATGTTTPPNPRAGAIRQVEYSEGLKIGYRWYASQGIEPLFSFGHGLSYTTFQYGQVQVSPTTSDGTGELHIRFPLTNTGTVAGTETAQVYIELPASTGEPSKRLLAWSRVTLDPGQTQQVEIVLSAGDLADAHLLQYWDTATGDWTTANGAYTVSVGGSFEAATAANFVVATCTSTLSANHTGPLSVTSGVLCIGNTTVTGPVSVKSGASLVANGTRFTGPLNASGAATVSLCGARVTGPLSIDKASIVVVGNPLGGCAANTVTGPVKVTNTAGLSILGGNRITGSFHCTGNVPPPTNNGAANIVTGPKSGQCAAL